MQNYHSAINGFPPANLTTPDGGSCCWATLILPYLEQEVLYRQYNLNVNWSAAANDSGVNQTVVKGYLCPSAPASPPRLATNNRAVTDYPALSELTRPNPYALKGVPPADPTYIGVLGHDVYRKVTDIADGSSNTVMVAESAGRNQCWEMGVQQGNLSESGAWANPGSTIVVGGFNPTTKTIPGPIAINGTNSANVYSFHNSVAGGLFADGSVRFLKASTTIDVLIALTTRASGELIPDNSY